MMKYDFYKSPTGQDVVLRIIASRDEVHRIAFTHPELQELKVAIEKYQEEQPMRSLREGRGHE